MEEFRGYFLVHGLTFSEGLFFWGGKFPFLRRVVFVYRTTETEQTTLFARGLFQRHTLENGRNFIAPLSKIVSFRAHDEFYSEQIKTDRDCFDLFDADQFGTTFLQSSSGR